MNISKTTTSMILAAALCVAQSAIANATNPSATAAAHASPVTNHAAAVHAAPATNHAAAAHQVSPRTGAADARDDYWPTHGKSRPSRPTMSPYASSSSRSTRVAEDDDRFLSIGVAFSYMALANGKRSRSDTFLGNITELELDDNFMVMPELGIEFGDYFRVGLTCSYLKIGTKNWNNQLGDGAARFLGPEVKAELRYPLLGGCLIPHAGGGAIFYNSSFDEDKSWKLGYSDYATWAAYGFTEQSAFGKFRAIEVDNVVAPLVTAGLAFRPVPAWEFDLSAIYTFAEPDCVFGYVNGKGVFGEMARGSFDIGCYGVTLSAAYRF